MIPEFLNFMPSTSYCLCMSSGISRLSKTDITTSCLIFVSNFTACNVYSRSGAVEKLQMSSTFDAQGDTIPIVNPMTPSTATPLVAFVSPPSLTTLMSAPVNQVNIPTTAVTSGAWCIAILSSSPTVLQVALDYACGYGDADCSAIQPGASCYDPDTIQDHASYAFNDYYQKNPIPTSCAFGGMAQLAYADPSQGNCHFASPTRTTTTPPITITPSPVVVSPPPLVYYTPTTTIPGPPTIYGIAEPTGSPSSATSIRSSLLIVLITTCLVGPMVIASGLRRSSTMAPSLEEKAYKLLPLLFTDNKEINKDLKEAF